MEEENGDAEHVLPPCFPTNQKGPAISRQPLVLIGGANRDRTGDLYNAIVALSQLSYGPIADAPREIRKARP